MKLLHSADWHLDSPLVGFTPEQQQTLRKALLQIPGKIASICRSEGCDMMLLSGDLFDGPYTRDSYLAVYQALEEVNVPVFITPGNHDFISSESPWIREVWPENVSLFKEPDMTSVALPQPRCWVFGAGFTAMDAPGMLEGFHADDPDTPLIGILHGDPTQVSSPYCPVTKKQVQESGLTYLALGHIHKQGSFRAGNTLCAWPGCPMGRGYDEQGEKGVLIVTLEESAEARFLPLDTPRFYDLEAEAADDPAAALNALLPPVDSSDFYRITLTGPNTPVDLDSLAREFSRFPNLVLRDRTTPPVDLWSAVGEDSFEGMYFSLLKKEFETDDPARQRIARLAARISRQILDGQEVKLP